MPIAFFRDTHEVRLPLEDADEEQSIFDSKLKNLGKGKKTIQKKFFK